MRFGTGGLAVGLAMWLLTLGCKEGRPIGQQQQGDEQAPAAQSARQPPKPSGEEQRVAKAPAPSPSPAPAPVPSGPAPGEQLIIGEVLAANDQELLVRSHGEPQLLLQVEPGTLIFVDGRQARGIDIEEGSQVRASFHEERGEPIATRIEVTTSPRPPTPDNDEDPPVVGPREAPFQAD